MEGFRAGKGEVVFIDEALVLDGLFVDDVGDSVLRIDIYDKLKKQSENNIMSYNEKKGDVVILQVVLQLVELAV